MPTLKVFWLNARTGRPSGGPTLPTERVETPCFSPDGKYLAFTPVDGTIRVWNLAAGKEACRVPTDSAFAFADGGRVLVTAGRVVRCYDATTGRQTGGAVGNPDLPQAVAFSPDGRCVVTASDGALRCWDAATGRLEWGEVGPRTSLWYSGWLGRGPALFAFAPGGSALFVADREDAAEVVRVLDPATGRERRRFDVGDGVLREATLSADGRTIHAVLGEDDGSAGSRPPLTHCVFDSATGERRRRDAVPVDAWNSLAFGGERWLADGRLYHRDGTLLRELPVDDHLSAGCLLAAGIVGPTKYERTPEPSDADRLVVADVMTGRTITEVAHRRGPTALSADGRFVAVAEADRLLVFESATGRERLRLSAPSSTPAPDLRSFATCLAWGPGNRSLAAGLADTTAVVWDTSSLLAPGERLTGEALATAWGDLASDDAPRSWSAVARMARDPQAAVPFLAERLRPAEAAPAGRVRDLLAALDSARFRRREAAGRELAALLRRGDIVVTDLSAEQRSGLARARAAAIQNEPSAEELRELRAVVALEWCRTPAALARLRKLAGGAAGDPLTVAAAGAAARLAPSP